MSTSGPSGSLVISYNGPGRVHLCHIDVSYSSLELQVLQTVKTQMSTLFFKVKKICRQKVQFFFQNYNLTPLDMYNGLFGGSVI